MPRNSDIAWRKRALILSDLAEVIYAPQRAFKKIVANPKYLGAILVLVLFIGLQIGFEYSQFSKTYTESTYPTVDQLYSFNNATSWQSSSNVALTNNFNDFYNYSVYIAGFGLSPSDPNAYYKMFGNNSMQIQANNTDTITAAIGNAFNVDCTPNFFQNLTIILKQVEPQTAPSNATLKLYSLSDSNFYTYDLTPQLSNSANIGQWNYLTIPLGPNYESSWTTTGSPQWTNITALTLNINYPSNSNITLRIGGLFFHGQYLTPIQYNSTGILLQFLQLFSLQFLFAWFVLTGIIYLVMKGLKGSPVWKPLFVAFGFAMIVMVIRAIINIIASLTLPTSYYPFDLSLGVRFDPFVALYYPADAVVTLPAQSQAMFATINAATEVFRAIIPVIAIISYVWLAALASFALKAAKPEFSFAKCIAIASVGLTITVLLLVFFIGAI